MSRTFQQQAVVDAVLEPGKQLIKVLAVAGAGKTFTLIELARELKPTNGIYLAYNKAIATEAESKFKGTTIKCSTVHSLAYQAVVKQYGLQPGFFNIRDVQPSTLPYKTKQTVATTMDKFLLSGYIDAADYYTEHETAEHIQKLINMHLDAMANGSITCSHSFYLKFYHILLANGTLTPPKVDLLMLDEFGDVNPIILAIFMLINAEKKIAVGDASQNIYSFNNTINGFKELQNEGIEMALTQSFRVSTPIATRIESFMQQHLDPSAEFLGCDTPHTETPTQAYISRGNSELVSKMFELQSKGSGFKLTRPIHTILELPLLLANINRTPIANKQYKVLEKYRKEYFTSKRLQMQHSTVLRYIKTRTYNDLEIQTGLKVVHSHGKDKLNKLAEYAHKQSAYNNTLTLTTAHSAKGLEWDTVTIAGDLNTSVMKALTIMKGENIMSEPDIKVINECTEECRLYYVACSRAMTNLKNATCLDTKAPKPFKL